MKARINKTLAERIEPEDRDVIVQDTVRKGFELKVTPKGKRVFQLAYRNSRGERRKPKIGELSELTVEEARAIAKDWLEAVKRGEDPSADRKASRIKAQTVGELWSEYLADSMNRWKPRTAINNQSVWKVHLSPHFSRRPLNDVSREMVRRFHRSLGQTPSAANHAVRLLRAMFNWAIEEGLVVSNPCQGVKQYKEVQKERYLRPDELPIIMAAIDAEEVAGGLPAVKRTGESKGRGGKGLKEAESRGISRHTASLFRLLLFTGARLSEIRLLEWRFVDWDAGRESRGALRLPDSKTGRKVIWLNTWARQELEALHEIRSQDRWVIEGRDPQYPLNNAQKPWGRVRDRCNQLWNQHRLEEGLEPEEPGPFDSLRIHDLRHSHASFALAERHSLEVIGAGLGHRNTRTTARYAHLAADPVEAMMEDVGRAIMEAANGEKGAVKPIRPSKKAEDGA